MGADKGEALRAFVALDLDASSLRRIGRVSDRLRMASGAPSAAWTPTLRMHVTLKFLGDIAPHMVEPIAQALRPLAEGKPAPAPSRFRLDAFPSVKDARIVVAELLDEDEALAKLAAKSEKLALKLVMADGTSAAPPQRGQDLDGTSAASPQRGPHLKEERAYRPHVTLARLKRPYDARKWLRPELADGVAACQVTHLTLYRSDLEGDAPTYVPLARFAFDL